jgi:hypothetical protein
VDTRPQLVDRNNQKKDVVPVSHRQLIMFFIATPTTIENRTAEGSNGSQANSVFFF